MDAAKLQVVLGVLGQEEGIAGGEVAKHHKVTEGLHDVPAEEVEST